MRATQRGGRSGGKQPFVDEATKLLARSKEGGEQTATTPVEAQQGRASCSQARAAQVTCDEVYVQRRDDTCTRKSGARAYG